MPSDALWHRRDVLVVARKAARVALYFIAPPTGYPNMKFNMGRIYTMTDGKDWTHPGDISGWDGNIERPTFNPSIWLSDRKGWHGYIQDGNLVDA